MWQYNWTFMRQMNPQGFGPNECSDVSGGLALSRRAAAPNAIMRNPIEECAIFHRRREGLLQRLHDTQMKMNVRSEAGQSCLL